MGHRDVVKLLMERGADTSVTDGTGRTLWMIAHMKDAGMAAFISGIEKDQRARQRQQEISDAVTALNEGLKEEMAPMRRLSFKTPASR
jgi:hypothetical protein